MFDNYQVAPISYRETRDFVVAHHYAKGIGQSVTGSFGLFTGGEMVGVCAFATPCSESVRASVWGPDYVSHVTELSRLVVLDVTPHSAESFFIARSLRLLKEAKPHLWGIVSFSDRSCGHVGTIYQASNAYHYGQSPARRFWLDPDDRLRHPRQCGRHVTAAEAVERGWRPVMRGPKERYALFLPDDKRHARWMRENLKLPQAVPYPKLGFNIARARQLELTF